MNLKKLSLIVIFAEILSACGGGSGSAAVNNASTSYTASLTLASNSPSVSSTDAATLTLTNAGSIAAPIGLTITMPSGFIATGFNAVCGSTMLVSSATQLSLSGATVPAGGSCTFIFTLHVPAPAYLPATNARTFLIASNGTAGVSILGTATAPTVSFLGSTPGLYSDTWFPSKITSVSVLDMFITPQADPGPNSNVFWSNQMGGLGGYTGLQSTVLVGAEGVGKQFLFSLWGATNAQTGTLPGAGIGAGSYCTVSGSATDGSAGAQCRYRYDWQVGHTYHFRVTPNTNLGSGWFTSNVTDVTPGSAGDSFDIGSIFVGATTVMVPTTYISQWIEYFDWNNESSSCFSVPYTNAQFSVEAVDNFGSAVVVPAPSAYANASCPVSFANVSVNGGVASEIGAPLQTAQGLFKAKGQCLTTQAGLTDSNSAGSNYAILGTCPTPSTVQIQGGSSFASTLWVWAADGTIETEYSYCLTAASTTAATGSAIVLQTCVPGAANQQWTSVQGPSGSVASNIEAKASGMCLTPSGNGLTLASCTASSAVWTPPGQSFTY